MNVNDSADDALKCSHCGIVKHPPISCEDVLAGVAAKPAVLSGGLSRGLCLINKALVSARAGGKRSARPRMLCLQGSPDATEQYIAVMNAIFAAQVPGESVPAPVHCACQKILDATVQHIRV